jgi:DNA transposition AAA+ family ATPase
MNQELKEARDTALAAEIPLYHQAIGLARDYMAKSQLTIEQLGWSIGYSGQTMNRFLTGQYHAGPFPRSTKNISAAISAFVQAHPVFEPQQQRAKLYRTENYEILLRWFEYCQQRGKMCCVYGPPGSQKTFAIEHIIAEKASAELAAGNPQQRAFYIYCSQGVSAAELVLKMAEAASLPARGRIQRNMTMLRFALRSRKALFVFDEAQHLSLQCLEVIRELNDLAPHFGVMLLGSHGLQRRFNERAAELEQWNSRIAQSIELPGISNETAERIVREELGTLADKSEKVHGLLEDCMVVDVYSRKREKRYRSARKLFNSLEVIKERAAALPVAGGIQ